MFRITFYCFRYNTFSIKKARENFQCEDSLESKITINLIKKHGWETTNSQLLHLICVFKSANVILFAYPNWISKEWQLLTSSYLPVATFIPTDYAYKLSIFH